MPLDEALPAQEFVDRQLVALAGVVEAKKATANCGDDFCLPADDPTLGVGWRKVRDC